MTEPSPSLIEYNAAEGPPPQPPAPFLLFTVVMRDDMPPLYCVGRDLASVVTKLVAAGVAPQAIVQVGPVWLAFD